MLGKGDTVAKHVSPFDETLSAVLEAAVAYISGLDDAPVGAAADLLALRMQLTKPLQDTGISPGRVISELLDDVRGGIVNRAGGRFFGWVGGGTLPAALAAEWLAVAWHQNAVIYAAAPAAVVVEEIVGAWLKSLFGLPNHASFALVSGTQMAHVTCLAAARHSLLARHGWDVEELGLYDAPPIRLLTSELRHASVERAAKFLGLGRSQLRLLPLDGAGGIDSRGLQDALSEAPSAPTILVLQAGDVNTGAFDPFDRILPIAKRYDAWVHVDGAFGLWAAASFRYRHLLSGCAAADSWAADGHKWLNVPYDCAYAFVNDPASHAASMSYAAPYHALRHDVREPIQWTPDWSRRARSFSTYAAIRELGRNGIAALVDRCCEHAKTLTARIAALNGTELLWEPVLNQGLVRFPDRRAAASHDDHDRHTDEVIARVVRSGEAFFTGTRWRGQRAMRISVCNWQTSDGDVERTVTAVAESLAASRAAKEGMP